MHGNRRTRTCGICSRIQSIKTGENPFFVVELKTGYVVLGDYQTFPGYTLFLLKEHAEELHELDAETKKEFLIEMSIVAKAIGKAFKPYKLNYELLGNTDRHLHWHIFPRYKDDPASGKPVWVLSKRKRREKLSTKRELREMKKKLRTALMKV